MERIIKDKKWSFYDLAKIHIFVYAACVIKRFRPTKFLLLNSR